MSSGVCTNLCSGLVSCQLQHSMRKCTCKRMLWKRHAEGGVVQNIVSRSLSSKFCSMIVFAGLKYIDLIHCHDIESAKDMKQVRACSCKPVQGLQHRVL